MTDLNQLQLPASFLALFVPPGRIRPTESREHMLARYEFCEDLAQTLVEHARTLLWQLGIAEEDVLERIGLGLAEESSGLEPPEAQWVVCRLAGLLGWPLPAPIPGRPGGSDGETGNP
ncbi:MAG: ATPase with chaperone activity [Gemmatimonadales bacterium]|nr:ATPase with chaperone activity [Gemmatimonadales bacterium]